MILKKGDKFQAKTGELLNIVFVGVDSANIRVNGTRIVVKHENMENIIRYFKSETIKLREDEYEELLDKFWEDSTIRAERVE